MDSTQQIKDKSVTRLNIIKATTHLEKLTQLDISMDWCFIVYKFGKPQILSITEMIQELQLDREFLDQQIADLEQKEKNKIANAN